MFSELDSILLLIERIVDEALECCVDMQMTKKGEQLFENVKNSIALQ
jgi:hypothetical protein